MYQNIIVIPYRNRESHLDYFIKNSVPLFQEHLPNTKILVVEQNEGKLFNRGALLNIGFKEYQNKTKYFFTHDVDINPSADIIKKVYSKEDINILRIKCPHNESLGCIVKFNHDSYNIVNGCPNYIWGWGIEDRALYYRASIRNIEITNNVFRDFKIMNHKSNAETYVGEKKRISDIWRLNYINTLTNDEKEKLIMESGLNNLEYTILETKQLHDMVELIKVDI